MISFSHVYKTYRGSDSRECHALRDVSLEIGKGEFVFLTGPSGAGKTTLFRMLSAFDKPSSGMANILGYNLSSMRAADLPAFRRRIGVVFQDFRLLRDRSAFDNVALPLEVMGEKSSLIQRRVMECLDQMGLADRRDELPDQLSGGEQQRIAIARALVHRPGLLIADEPTGNLDSEKAEEIMELFERANAQGTTLFVATHDQSLVEKHGKRVVAIRSGQVVSGAKLDSEKLWLSQDL